MSKASTHTEQPAPQQEAFLLSGDPARAMQEMMDTIDSLRDVYLVETEALESSDTGKFLEIQEQKLDIARKYQQGIQQLIKRKDEMRDVNPLLKKRLEDMQAEFSDLTKKNMEALERMQRSTERLGETIMNAAKDAAKEQSIFSYGETGTMKGAEKKSVSMGISETA